MGLQINIIKQLPGFRLELSLESGQEILGILGASGSGKSMLLGCIAGLIKPDEGRIVLNGRTFFDSEARINLPPGERKVGFLFQNYALFPHLTIADNIAFGLGSLSKEEQKRRVGELMERFHLHGLGERYPSQISGGQQQRTALARAMAVEPEILLLDEPFSALDDHLRMHMIKEMQDSLRDFQGVTLCVTHSIEEAYRLSHRILVLHQGKLEAASAKEDLFQHPPTLEAARITGCKNLAPAVRISEDRIQIPDWGIQVQALCEAVPGYAGIRANHIRLAEGEETNSYAAWVADESRGPFRTTLFLKLGAAPSHAYDYHLQWELSREKALELRDLSMPIRICLDREKLFFVG